MTPDRFTALAAAYGGTIARWPEAERAAAAALLAVAPALRAVLAVEDRLDARLDDWRVAAPSAALAARIEADATIRCRRRLRLWWSALGIGAALSGATAGTLAAAAVPSSAIGTQADDDDTTTAFGDAAGDVR